jgi:hypothetical protein
LLQLQKLEVKACPAAKQLEPQYQIQGKVVQEKLDCILPQAVWEKGGRANKKKRREPPRVWYAWNEIELYFGNQVRSYPGWYLMRFAVDGSQ